MKDRSHNKPINSRRTSPQRLSKLDRDVTIFLYYFTVFFVLSGIVVIPSLLGEAYIDFQNEAKNNIGAIVRDQQGYALENSTLTRQINSLRLGMSLETINYSYRILHPSRPTQTQISLAFETKNLPAIAVIAYPKSENLKVYLGIVWMSISPHDRTESMTRTIVCVSKISFGELKDSKNNEFLFPNFTYPSQTDTKFSCPVNFIDADKATRKRSILF